MGGMDNIRRRGTICNCPSPYLYRGGMRSISPQNNLIFLWIMAAKLHRGWEKGVTLTLP
jgi:hypothetical protein